MSDLVNVFWLGLLAAAAGWTTLFSMFNRPHIRGWRNVGILAGYGLGVAMFFALPWKQALGTWATMGVLGGGLYVLYELVAHLRLAEKSADSRPRLGPLLHGLFLWPIMLPEAVEYLLAELGVLKPQEEAQEDA
jgi:hypothetical protein